MPPEFSVRSDSVDVDQIMTQIRARISERERGIGGACNIFNMDAVEYLSGFDNAFGVSRAQVDERVLSRAVNAGKAQHMRGYPLVARKSAPSILGGKTPHAALA